MIRDHLICFVMVYSVGVMSWTEVSSVINFSLNICTCNIHILSNKETILSFVRRAEIFFKKK